MRKGVEGAQREEAKAGGDGEPVESRWVPVLENLEADTTHCGNG